MFTYVFNMCIITYFVIHFWWFNDNVLYLLFYIYGSEYNFIVISYYGHNNRYMLQMLITLMPRKELRNSYYTLAFPCFKHLPHLVRNDSLKWKTRKHKSVNSMNCDQRWFQSPNSSDPIHQQESYQFHG